MDNWRMNLTAEKESIAEVRRYGDSTDICARHDTTEYNLGRLMYVDELKLFVNNKRNGNVD